jgi:hypothetical protein
MARWRDECNQPLVCEVVSQFLIALLQETCALTEPSAVARIESLR